MDGFFPILIPLMVVFQQNKSKVCPVLDFRELNEYVDAYTVHAYVCAQNLRKKGSNSISNRCICKCVCTNPCGRTRQLSLKEKGTAYRAWILNSM